MEFFEKAHVHKSSSRKDSKSEESMKKQLKQMLHGYKQSDNELIKNSGNVYRNIADTYTALDESSSVSGFSDLDLTMSEEEAEMNSAMSSEVCIDNASSCSDVNLSSNNNLGEQPDDINNDNTDISMQDLVEVTEDCLYPISEADEDMGQLSEDSDAKISSFSNMLLLDSVGSPSCSLSTDTASEEFDPDGSLAYKIMEKLKENQLRLRNEKEKIIEKKKTLTNIKRSLNKYSNNIQLENIDNDKSVAEAFAASNVVASSPTSSPPFISIIAEDMPDQSFSDIVGDYKYPTVRNFPCEKENISTANNCGISFDDEIKVEDTDSLIPEIGEDPVIEDIEMDLDATADSDSISISENTDISTINITPITKDSNKRIRDVENTIQLYYTDDACIIILKHPTGLYLNGKIKLKPLGGTLEVFGYTLKKEVCLYGPNNSFSYCLKTVAVTNEYFGIFGKLTSSGLSVKDVENIVTSLGEYDCVISLSSLQNPKIDFVDEHFSIDLFRKLKVENTAHRLTEASNKVECNIYLSKPIKSFRVHLEWEEAIDCGLKEYSRGIICGGKGVGKSTFLRYYVNRMLDSGPILVIDLDPGQAEFTVAGCISATIVDEPLLGPNYTHLKTPNISYNIGMISTLDNTLRYAAAIAKLINHCHRRYHSMPWIINTMGMTNNMGLKFLLLTIIRIQPTFLMQVDCDATKKGFECYLEPDEIRTLYKRNRRDKLFRGIVLPEDFDYNFVLTRHVEGYYKQHTALAPKENRYLNFLAYFGELMNIHKGSFLDVLPYRLNLSELNIVTNVKMEKVDILKVINGKIIALCQLDTTEKGKVFTLDNNALVCYGHGLIRGVESETNAVYLVTPEAEERLCAVNALVYSDWTPELQGTESHLSAGTAVPYRTTSTDNQHMRAPQRRFNPLKLLKTRSA